MMLRRAQRGFLLNPYRFGGAAARAVNGFGFFAGGENGAGTVFLSSTDKYTFSADTSAASTALSATRGTDRAVSTGAAGGSGYIGGGDNGTVNLTTVDKFAWATMTRSAGTALNIARSEGGAAGNSSRGIFAGDAWNGQNPITTSKYTYSGDTVAAGGSFTSGAVLGTAATGDATAGYYDGADGTGSKTAKYTYSGDTFAATTTATSPSPRAGFTSGPTIGYYCSTTDTVQTNTTKLTYSSVTYAAGTALTVARQRAAGMGNDTRAIFGGGLDGTGAPISSTQKYTFSGDTTAAGGALSVARGWEAGCSADPGGFSD
jgi:hypothetical protein